MNGAVIFMATYNGGHYIEEQLQSLQAQTFRDWVCLVSDDGSSDDTLSILEDYARSDKRFIIVQNSGEHGAYANFYNAMRAYRSLSADGAEYFFYCDQDDIWRPDKMERQIALLAAVDVPALCYTDLELMDSDGNSLGERLSERSTLDLTDRPLTLFFISRHIWGTTMAHNKSLWDMLALPGAYANELAHDWYIPKFAALYGSLLYLDRPTVLYRRHASNVSALPGRYGVRAAFRRATSQLGDVVKGHASLYGESLRMLDMAQDKTRLHEDLVRCLERGGLSAVIFLVRHRIKTADSLYNQLALYLILLTGAYRREAVFTERRHFGAPIDEIETGEK